MPRTRSKETPAMEGGEDQPFDNLTGADFGQFDQQYEVVDVDAIKPHPRNPNKGDVELIQRSIEHNTWYGACTVQRSTGYILVGEHRWRAAKVLGVLQIPVIWKDCDDVQAVRIMLVDNESARAAEYDQAALQELLDELAPIDADGMREDAALVGTGFTLAVVEAHEREREEAAASFEAQEAAQRAKVRERAEGNAAGGLSADDVPDDSARAAREYGLLLVCESEDDQRLWFERLKKLEPSLNLRVVAV